MNELRDFYVDRTSLDTLRSLTIQAALCFYDSLFCVVAVTYFFKVCGSHLRILLADRNAFLVVTHLFNDTAYMTLVAFFFLFSFKNLMAFYIVVHSLTFHHILPVDLIAVEFRTVDAGEFCLATNSDTASTAHTCTINHDGVKTYCTFDAEFCRKL